MALEKIHGTQVVSWAPPLPQRAFQITGSGVTSDNTNISGLAVDGVRYGYYTVNTAQWAVVEGLHTAPMQAGEQFQIVQANTAYAAFWVNPPMFGTGNAVPSKNNNPTAPNAPDLFNVSGLFTNREMGGNAAPYQVLDTVIHTVVAVQQAANSSWTVYFAPVSPVTVPLNTSGIVTLPKPYSPKYLGQIGHVSGISYTYSIPGGPDQFTCLLQVEPNYRTDALNVGRIITLHRGASCIWEGQLTEPQPASTGWTLIANGVGTYGTNFGAWWEPGAGPKAGSSGWLTDPPIDFAIARGLRWQSFGIGNPTGIYIGPVQNPGSLSITDFLNLLCTGGSLTWELVQPAGASSWPPAPWVLNIYQMPTDYSGNPLVGGPGTKVQTYQLLSSKWQRTDNTNASARKPPDLYLVNNSPIARTVVASYNTIILYYQSSPDATATSTTTATAATYATTMVDSPGAVKKFGRMEYTLDISNAGSMTAAAAQQIGLNVLSKYIRANFAASFTIGPGMLLNVGGYPVDLGCNWVGYMCTVQGINAALGGEVAEGPLTFMIGQYEYDDDTQTAVITPYQNALTDIDSVVSALYPGKFA